MERRDATQLGLHGHRLLPGDLDDVGRAVGVGLVADRPQLGDLRLVGRDDELSAAPVRHAVRAAVLVEEMPPRDAGARLERALGVVDAGVDHLGVARARVRADAAVEVLKVADAVMAAANQRE